VQEILVAAAGATPHRLGLAVTDLAGDGERVAVSFTDGSSSDFDLVVAADGHPLPCAVWP
jgi:2-polyprenyl-6-methoxyphenol hydroxylase-like FAD-dependent oxidoreductase